MEKRIEIIQSYRGILAFIVFLGHTWGFYNSTSFNTISSTPFHIFFDGQAAVLCFFVLSGFFMRYEEWRIATYYRKIVKRLIRLLPTYVLTTVAAFVIYKLTDSIGMCPWLSGWGDGLWKHDYNIIDLIRNLCFLSTREHTWMNPAAWYMQMDMEMMLAMPILIGLAYRYSKWLLLLAIPLSFEGHLYPIIAVTTGFCVRNLLKNKAIQVEKWNIGIILIVGIICLNIRNIWLNYNTNITLYIQTIGAGLLLFGILKADFDFLKNKILVWFGNYSYEFYLIHMIVMLGFRGLGLNHLYFILSVFLLSLFASVILHKLSAMISERMYKC